MTFSSFLRPLADTRGELFWLESAVEEEVLASDVVFEEALSTASRLPASPMAMAWRGPLLFRMRWTPLMVKPLS